MLILAATPIGNLDDASARLRQVLIEADLVYAEDTRVTRKLLRHFGCERELFAYHEHSVPEVRDRIAGQLRQGLNVAFVSDAGTPGINDPGYRLVQLAHELGVAVDAVPGPSAPINALILSGLPSHAFCFLGYFPETRAKRQAMVERLPVLAMTAIFFESPNRIASVLEFLQATVPNAQIAICREMTKLHQQVLRGTPAGVAAALEVYKGEFVLLIGPLEEAPMEIDMESRYRELRAEGLPLAKIAKTLSQEFRVNKREVYQQFQDRE